MAPQGFSAQKEAPGRGLNPPAGGSFFDAPQDCARPASAPGSTRTGRTSPSTAADGLLVGSETRGGPDHLRWFWSLTVDPPMARSDRVLTLEEAKAQFGKSWDAWKAWAKLEQVPQIPLTKVQARMAAIVGRAFRRPPTTSRGDHSRSSSAHSRTHPRNSRLSCGPLGESNA